MAALGGTPDPWPSVDLAYDWVRPAYDSMLTRLNLVDGRLHSILALATTITIGLPVLMSVVSKTVDFSSGWLLLAIGAFVLVAVAGLLGGMIAGTTVVNPERLYQGWLHLPPREFKTRAIYWAGVHFTKNNRIAGRKTLAANATVVLFLVEILFLTLWIRDSF